MHRKWWGLLALMPALAMMFVDQSVLPVALPTIQKQLGATNLQLQWCLNAYLLVTAVLVLAGGKLGDRIGHRKNFILGMLIFAAASALCGLSGSVPFLIAARGFQGVGAAMIFPASSPLLMSLFPSNERGKAVGLQVSLSSLFLIFGPLIGGYLTQMVSWRWIFWINLPLAALGVFLVLLFIPPSPKREQKVDFWGFFAFAVSCSALIIVIMQARDWGWTSAKSLSLFALCLIAGFFLFQREKKAKHPFLEFSLFKLPVYKAVNISIFATQFILMITVYRAIFFQDVLDWTPIKAGTITVLTTTPVLFISPIGGWLSDKFGPKLPITLGFILLIYSFFWSAFFIQGALGVLLLGFFALGFGVPLVFTPAYSSAMGAVPPQKAGVAFGTLATTRSIATTLGVAVIASFTEILQVNKFHKLIESDANTSSLDFSLLESFASASHRGFDYLKTLSIQKKELVLRYLRESEFDAFFYCHIALACALIVAFAFVFVLYHRKSSHRLPPIPGEGWD